MDCNILKTDGFTLIELSVVMGIVAILSTAVFPVAVRTLELKAAEKTVEEIKTIQQAASRFYRDQKAWPMDLSQMQTLGYVSSLWSLENPWKGPYQMSSTSNTLMVSTSVPKSVVGMLALRLPQTSVDQNTVTSVITSGGASETTTAGIIVAWSGTIADIPQGWALCDGNDGTPDLRDQFIVGASQDEAGIAKTNITGTLNQKGGTVSHIHDGVAGAHVLTIAEIPAHSHGYYKPLIYGSYDGHSSPLVTEMVWTQSETVGGGEGHTHAIGSDVHLPPYYALAFIMKRP